MTPPDFNGLASSNSILSRFEPALNNGFPWPRSTGVRARSSSSNKPCCKSVEERSALPKTNNVFPGCLFSFLTSSTTFSFTSVVLFQSAFFSVLENTTFGIVFMKSAMSPFCDGQYEAIPSYVTRPNNSAPVDFDCSMAYCSISSPQTVSCQSISQLFGPSKKPSSVTKFHMISFLMSFPRFKEVNRAIRIYALPGSVQGIPYALEGPCHAGGSSGHSKSLCSPTAPRSAVA